MSTLRQLGCLVLGLSVNLSAAFAEDAVIQQFGDWTITIQPGVRADFAVVPPSPAPATIRLISQQVDQEQLPPSPAEPGKISIIPGTGLVTSPPAQAAGQKANPLALVQLYPQVYNAIPFSRAEYAAYPSYRHDATMEFLFGQMRPTVIQRGTASAGQRYHNNYAHHMPAYSPYGFNSYYYPFYTPYYQPYSLW